MRSPVNQAVALALLIAGGGVALAAPPMSRKAPASGPAADYPIVVGEPFTIGATTWTPADQLNYDAVGLSGVQPDLAGVSAAHKTLPLPGYVEVTSLASGRTILVRIVERGPMVNDTLLALSPDAAAQLGIEARAPVRVRRVNPPEIERAALRAGGRVPQLLKVLRRKLAEQAPLLPPPTVPPQMPVGVPPKPSPVATLPSAATVAAPSHGSAIKAVDGVNAAAASATAPAAKARERVGPVPKGKVASKNATIVQVAAFSSAERAKSAAAKLRGDVSRAGRFWQVRLGPFANDKAAFAALGKAKAAGYSDARIQRAD
jgi:rare lipoprotein A